jgi:hypothetical protein
MWPVRRVLARATGARARVPLTRFVRAKKSATPALGIAHKTAWSADE